jgi:hypothetical protein
MRPSRALHIVLLLLIAFSTSPAQFFYFGRNKVQYTEFDWHVLKTEHFDIYYYPEMKDLAGRGAAMAEESFTILEKKFNHSVGGRIPLIFYSSHLHFQQTNVTPGFIPEGVGGFFEFLKGRVVIPFNGSLQDFRHVIRHELVHVFMHSKVSRVLEDHRIVLDRLPPLWFVEGLAEYWSTDWDTQAEMVMRDATVSNYVVPLDDIDRIYGSYLMYKEGQNILQFVGRRYGEEKVLLMMEQFWKSSSFEEVFRLVTGRRYEEFDAEWLYDLKKQYYPILATSDAPGGASRELVSEGFNSKPVHFRNGSVDEIYYLGNTSGYTNIMKVRADTLRAVPEVVIRGERTDEFETFHLFQSRMDVSKEGLLAFVTKSGETDALHIFDLRGDTLRQTLRFKDFVVLGSSSWSPDANRIAFSAIDKSGENDLYVWDFSRSELTQLTNDFYDDRDPAWSPDGTGIVFSSDRSPGGEHGKYNLFRYDVTTRNITYVTNGAQSYSGPSWSPDGSALIFTSDLDGARNVWMMKIDSSDALPRTMRKLTSFTTGSFDPCWSDSELVFVAFEKFSFQIRSAGNIHRMYDSSTTTYTFPGLTHAENWKPAEVSLADTARTGRYVGDYSLDFAQSQISTDPVFGTAGGGFVAFSDLLGNEQYYFLVYNTAQSSSELLTSFNVAISRVSLGHRTSYAYGVYRFTGRRYDLRDPDEFFFERSFGAYFALSYPFSKFNRLELTTSLTNSEKELIEGVEERRALLLSNSVSYTHDNSLWGPSGPLDGSRFNMTLAYTSDIEYSNASYYSFIFDYRRYIRLGVRSAYASRYWLFYNEGKEARRFFMGGSWDLRGYPRWSIRGKKLWLTSHELRFPFLDQVRIGFPFGGVTFVGVRGALFVDAGNAWDETYEETLGSFGFGVRLNLGGYLVLRYDLGKRIEDNLTHLQDGIFHQFFFGFDF